MLRLISVFGITIAMVIGFIAVSSQMKDDFTVRSRVVDVIKEMKALASDELQCSTTTGKTTTTPGSEGISSDPTSEKAVEMTADLELRSTQGETPEAIESDGIDPVDPSPDSSIQTESIEATEQAVDQLQDSPNADIVETMDYEFIQPGTIELVTVFKDIYGESSKRRIKAGSRLIIQCDCKSQALSCKIHETNINKNYFPKNISKREQAK